MAGMNLLRGPLWVLGVLAGLVLFGVRAVAAEPAWHRALLDAYPAHLERIEGNTLDWRNGTSMPLDDGKGVKPFDTWLEEPDIEDMFSQAYPAGEEAKGPALNFDPGRARNAAFFNTMYGDCRAGEVEKNLTEIVWLPEKAGQRLKVTAINGVAEKLSAVSRELDALPVEFDRFLVPAAGTYNCRVIAGTNRVSAHGHAIAIDIAIKHAHYWRWAAEKEEAEKASGTSGPGGSLKFQNEIPMEIVHIFEKHGFIWGGRWSHYDTMHFEYRPELLVK